MTKTRLVFETGMPAARDDLSPSNARGRVLAETWRNRREIEWRIATEPLSGRSKTHPTRHEVTLGVVNAGETPEGERIDIVRLAIDVETGNGEDALDKAKRVLDLPRDITPRGRTPRGRTVTTHGSLHRLGGDAVIGPMPMRWPVGRRITDYSHNLGSYGQGGVGLSGWQLNGGSWMVLPLSGSDSWITLTFEGCDPSDDRSRLDIVVDQRIVGVHPDQKADFPPWEHLYAGHEGIEDLPDFPVERPEITRFSASGTGFVLEAGGLRRNWRFEMGDHLPRPIWGGSLEPRDLAEGESIVDAFVLTHDCYLEV